MTCRVYDADGGRCIYSGPERAARRAAAAALGCDSLRGLAQAPTERGVLYYAPAADDDDGTSVELVY